MLWESRRRKIHLPGVTEISNEKEYFTIKAVHRSHLTEKDYDVADVDDNTMQLLADSLEEVYIEVYFWKDLKAIAKDLGIPMKRSLKKS